ncbi:hypothetical protein [Streptomyces caatingaensis]|uniref:hypothetical protein n=1 Tax=Streptomyces caatingaensis TaxID=1678637 RepID=UPI000672772D|nr:hypothetical protein [Streptomyces caatingaensis]
MAWSTGKQRQELETLKSFKGRVDDALTKLGSSEAAPSRIGASRLNQAHLGKGFDSVGALHAAYLAVHEDLTTLSQLFADQIEALSLAIQGAHNGYAETDARHRQRMWAVQQQLTKHYDPKLDPHTPKTESGGGTGPDAGGTGGTEDKGGM